MCFDRGKGHFESEKGEYGEFVDMDDRRLSGNVSSLCRREWLKSYLGLYIVEGDVEFVPTVEENGDVIVEP
jgi:hypothetical protein